MADSEVLHLIVRADDAGGSRAANEGILLAATQGIVRNVSVMACGRALDHCVQLLAPLVGQICFGLHATINSEWSTFRWGPVLPPNRVPSLVREDGSFHVSPMALSERGFSSNEILAEVAAQLARLRAAGLPPEYLDTHMGFDWIEGVHERLAQFALAEGLVFDTRARLPMLPGRGSLLERLSGSIGGPFLLVTHPAILTEETLSFFEGDDEPGLVAREREAELRELCSPQIKELVISGTVILRKYLDPREKDKCRLC
jgi:hypothetical protein